ncbi:hypothetical protein CVT26_010429 [Gymnopilus dilepis]|uniref:Ubiquitin-like protease family profile domain-containing protein n=1 Tax=Gymnopilus dilepis TaxID=231916 RepID=A0A409Y0P0_9AGAR|nr:hypothetical protein CVT26_010429 [Gymnopilus dilepis]
MNGGNCPLSPLGWVFTSQPRRKDARMNGGNCPLSPLGWVFTSQPRRNTTGSELATDLAGCSPQDTDTACVDIAVDAITPDPSHPPSQPPPNPSIAQPPMKPKRLVPDQAALNLSEKWETLLPSLVPDLLAYYKAWPVGQQLIEAFSSPSCTEMKSIKVLALHFGHFRLMDITHCQCRTTAQVLVRAGLFLTAPSQIRMAFSIDFLDFYMKLFERSCDAVNTIAAALDSFYNHRKFYLLNKKDENFREPFRRGLGYAVKWLDMLHARLERLVGEALEDADTAIRRADPSINESIQSDPIPSTKSNSLLPNEFHLKNLPQVPHQEKNVGHSRKEETFIFLWMEIFTIVILSQEGRGFPFIPLVMSFPNPSSTKSERSSKKHANQNQNHEKPKFPTKRSMNVKIRCVLDRSTELYDILPPAIRRRVQFCTTAMHAYGHQWACQLAYNPRFIQGMGLSDGEGVERIWAMIRKLIPLVRTSSAARRLWMTDRQLTFVAEELRDGLGDWIKNHLERGIKAQGNNAQSLLDECGFTVSRLRDQWNLQKEAQMSLRAHAPVRLKKEIDTLLSLQTELEDDKKAIQTTQSTLSSAPKKTTKILKNLLENQEELIDDLEELYSSLEIQDSFPDLEGVDLEFVRVLLLARDQKIVIRQRAIGSFFEWDRLDQAVGGRNQALGTKLHQQTRKAIAKRQPSLISAIKRFNRYCARLEELYDPSYKIPLPAALPTKLDDLRQDPNLMEDVWIERSEVETPPWLEDQDVRTGIRAMLKKDRCKEEQRRLGWEADNLCQWFGRELAAVQVALRSPKNAHLVTQLTSYRDHLLHLNLKDICINGLASFFQTMTANDSECNPDYSCAIFSTHDLVRIHYKASDQDLWRSISRSQYWNASVWIIPIHRPRESHWVLAAANVLEGRIYLYDSLASMRGWQISPSLFSGRLRLQTLIDNLQDFPKCLNNGKRSLCWNYLCKRTGMIAASGSCYGFWQSFVDSTLVAQTSRKWICQHGDPSWHR